LPGRIVRPLYPPDPRASVRRVVARSWNAGCWRRVRNRPGSEPIRSARRCRASCGRSTCYFVACSRRRRAGAPARCSVHRSVSRRTSAHKEDGVPEPTRDPVHSPFTGVAFPLTAARTSPRPGLRSWAIVAAAALVGAVTLGAQAPATEAEIPLPSGAQRQPQLEPRPGGSEGGDTRSIRVYRWAAPTEPVLRFYLLRLSANRDVALDTASLASLRPGQTSPISYHLAFHSFEDQCADSAGGASTGGAAPKACKVRRRAKDKQRALGGRLGLEPGLWVERATFTWFSRDTGGELIRWRLELRDSGLSNNWQHYTPSTQLTIERVLVKASAP